MQACSGVLPLTPENMKALNLAQPKSILPHKNWWNVFLEPRYEIKCGKCEMVYIGVPNCFHTTTCPQCMVYNLMGSE